MAPNYDNNIALISRGYPSDVSRTKDGLLRIFKEFLAECPKAKEMYRSMSLPVINEETIRQCLDDIPIKADAEYITSFILNGQSLLDEFIHTDDIEEGVDESYGLTL